MRQASTTLVVTTPGKGLHNVTPAVEAWVADQGLHDGLLTVFLRHTSASLVIQENADPDVCADLDAFFRRLAPEDERLYRHSDEGPDDMPAHIKAALTNTQLSIPLIGGRLALGTWQGIYLFEHRARSHRRQMVLHLLGD
jgi:secondary thiamine-phosphate synthase enzyme